jgi:hypothetical protein
MKLVLISPKGPLYRHRGGIFKKSLRYAPLTLTTLASLVPPELEVEVRLIDEGIQDVDLVLGGPHVTLIPDDAQPHADAVVRGRAPLPTDRGRPRSRRAGAFAAMLPSGGNAP